MSTQTSTQANPLVRLGELGQSPWYDYITRDLIASGELRRLIAEDGLRGMTSNPTIFEKALAEGTSYDSQLAEIGSGVSAGDAFERVATQDVRRACDIFRGVYDATNGHDGFVSL